VMFSQRRRDWCRTHVGHEFVDRLYLCRRPALPLN
jgi:hypothetical protein